MAGATRLQSVTISVRAASHTTLTSAKNRRRSKQRRRFSSEMTDKNDKSKVDLGLLEEDDEFEEFPAEDWTAKDEDNADISVWEDNWDDDDVEDDFNQQLRAQLEKQKAQGGDSAGKEN